ncbi:hypothetical protein, partial [Oenococcus oeni]|uniref:hypothetical protein n=1 Tax=Oenococcus oeni TaxID=1247 RepID=UPI0015D66610
ILDIGDVGYNFLNGTFSCLDNDGNPVVFPGDVIVNNDLNETYYISSIDYRDGAAGTIFGLVSFLKNRVENVTNFEIYTSKMNAAFISKEFVPYFAVKIGPYDYDGTKDEYLRFWGGLY